MRIYPLSSARFVFLRKVHSPRKANGTKAQNNEREAKASFCLSLKMNPTAETEETPFIGAIHFYQRLTIHLL